MVADLLALQPNVAALPSVALIDRVPSDIKYFHDSRYSNY
jgi:hypothetical protein